MRKTSWDLQIRHSIWARTKVVWGDWIKWNTIRKIKVYLMSGSRSSRLLEGWTCMAVYKTINHLSFHNSIISSTNRLLRIIHMVINTTIIKSIKKIWPNMNFNNSIMKILLRSNFKKFQFSKGMLMMKILLKSSRRILKSKEMILVMQPSAHRLFQLLEVL